jgi:hypothetical protein
VSILTRPSEESCKVRSLDRGALATAANGDQLSASILSAISLHCPNGRFAQKGGMRRTLNVANYLELFPPEFAQRLKLREEHAALPENRPGAPMPVDLNS